MSENPEILTEDLKNLLRNYFCLVDYFKTMLSQAEREYFKTRYPRTWNAIETDDGTTFDLPVSDSEQLSDSEK